MAKFLSYFLCALTLFPVLAPQPAKALFGFGAKAKAGEYSARGVTLKVGGWISVYQERFEIVTVDKDRMVVKDVITKQTVVKSTKDWIKAIRKDPSLYSPPDLVPLIAEEYFRAKRENAQNAASSSSGGSVTYHREDTGFMNLSNEGGGSSAQGPQDPKLPPIPKIKVTGSDGNTVDAWGLINEFCVDLVKKAKENGFVYTDDPELREIEDQILKNFLKPEGGSVKLLALAGVGKTILVYKRLMARIANGDMPDELKAYRFMSFSADSIDGGSKNIGFLTARTNAMTKLSEKVPIIWVIDEFHALASIGKHSRSDTNILQALKPPIADGQMKVLALSTPDEWAGAYAGDFALDRRFSRVDMHEPSGERLMKMLREWAERFKAHITDEQHREAIKYSDRFAIEGVQPSRATALLAEVVAERKFSNSAETGDIAEIQRAARRLYGLDPAEFDPQLARQRYHDLEVALQDLAGQHTGKETIKAYTRQVLERMQDSTKPRYRLVLAGPKGLGKTEIVSIVARSKGLSEDQVRIMMSEYPTLAQLDALKARVATLVRRKYNTVLFFDEIEKASLQMQKALLGMVNSGVMTLDSRNGDIQTSTTIRLHNTDVFMATNAGTTYIDNLQDEKKFSESEFRIALEQGGIDELLLDRMEKAVPFFYSSMDDFREVLRIHLHRAIKQIKANNGSDIHLDSDDWKKMIDDLSVRYYTPRMSNRDVTRIVSDALRQNVTDYLFAQNLTSLSLHMVWNGQQLVAKESTYDGLVASCAKIVENGASERAD